MICKMVMTQNLASLTLFKFSSHRRHITAAAAAAAEIDGARRHSFACDVAMTACVCARACVRGRGAVLLAREDYGLVLLAD